VNDPKLEQFSMFASPDYVLLHRIRLRSFIMLFVALFFGVFDPPAMRFMPQGPEPYQPTISDGFQKSVGKSYV
jgi:hypothetical protein